MEVALRGVGATTPYEPEASLNLLKKTEFIYSTLDVGRSMLDVHIPFSVQTGPIQTAPTHDMVGVPADFHRARFRQQSTDSKIECQNESGCNMRRLYIFARYAPKARGFPIRIPGKGAGEIPCPRMYSVLFWKIPPLLQGAVSFLAVNR